MGHGIELTMLNWQIVNALAHAAFCLEFIHKKLGI